MSTKDISVEYDERILSVAPDENVCPIYTIPLNEFKVKEFCQDNGIVCYLPLKKTSKFHEYSSNGKLYSYSKVVLRPMFPSYVIVKMNRTQQAMLWTSRKIIRILAPVSQARFLEDIRAVHAFELTGLQQKVEFNADISEGDLFVIESGMWAGVTGRLKRKDNTYEWTVELDFINQFIRTTLDPSTVKMRRVEP